jgi:hypothetical protein
MNSNRFFDHVHGGRLVPTASRIDVQLKSCVKLLVLVEGQHDVTFLRSISCVLHADDGMVSDLGELERAGKIVMLPVSGGDILSWPPGWRRLDCPNSTYWTARFLLRPR